LEAPELREKTARIVDDMIGSPPLEGSSSTEDIPYFAHVQELEKKAEIADLVELMEEMHMNKEWLLEQVKNKRQKIQLKPGMQPVTVLKMCQRDFVTHLIGTLKNLKLEGYNVPPPLSKTYHWFFTDIVAGADPSLTTHEQYRKISVLNKVIADTETFKQRDPEATLLIPTGDGMAIGFHDSPEKPLRLALEVHESLYRYNKPPRKENDRIFIRVGLDTGPVYMIKDLNGNENVWGPGIIMARRIMDLAREMNILASGRFASDVRMLKPEYKDILYPIGDYKTKHGEEMLIYNVCGDGFGSKKSPIVDKRQQSKIDKESQETRKRFRFSNIDIKLEVKDPDETIMMTHHKWIWNIINISKEPVEKVFYYLDGDSSRPFPDLNVTVKDEFDRELEIMSLNVNKPYHKEFFVKLRRPLKPGEKGRSTTLEYDWEEPDRHFLYRFASDCNRFAILLTLPKAIEAHQKVTRVEFETGDKFLAEIPAVVRYLPSTTEISWSKVNIKAGEAYRFDW